MRFFRHLQEPRPGEPTLGSPSEPAFWRFADRAPVVGKYPVVFGVDVVAVEWIAGSADLRTSVLVPQDIKAPTTPVAVFRLQAIVQVQGGDFSNLVTGATGGTHGEVNTEGAPARFSLIA